MRLPIYLLLVAVFLSACTAGIQKKTAELADLIHPGESVAVGVIYDDSCGDVSTLSNRWRDEIEAALTAHGVQVKSRKDIGFIIDDLDSFGPGVDEQRVWDSADADLLILGSYQLQPDNTPPQALLTLKLLDLHTSGVRQTLHTIKDLPPDWGTSAMQCSGNVFQKSVEIVADNTSPEKKPSLAAHLSRDPACFPSGAEGKILVQTEAGVHIYLLNLAADQSVTKFYPNRLMPDQPLTSARFEFPPRALEDEVQMQFYPLTTGQTSRESIKVIASYFPIDFSYLPVPENTIYAGARGGDIKRVLESLKQARGWSEQVLDYMVGAACR